MRLLFDKYSAITDDRRRVYLNGNMFQEDLIDELLLIHLPFIAGGEDTPSLVTGLHPRDVSDLLKLDLITQFMAGENLITKWRVVRS